MNGLDYNKEITVADDKEIDKDINFEYSIFIGEKDSRNLNNITDIKFQRGTVENSGANGCSEEDIIQILLDRIRDLRDIYKNRDKVNSDIIDKFNDLEKSLMDSSDLYYDINNYININEMIEE